MNIDEMPAGVELDILVAKALGYIEEDCRGSHEKGFAFIVASGIHSLSNGVHIKQVAGSNFMHFAPSVDIRNVWAVVEELHVRGFYLRLDYENEGAEWYCEINNAIGGEPASIGLEVKASSAPLAICYAALKVMGVD